MTAQLLDGNEVAATIKWDLASRVARLADRGAAVGLGTLLVGNDPASRSYVAGKHRDCAAVGVTSIAVELPANASFDDIAAAVTALNADPAVTGFIVQLPLPEGIDANAILELIDPRKDADGLHPVNLGRLVLGGSDRGFALPCTPLGIVELLRHHGIELAGRRVAVIGRGVTVGRPLGLLLTRRGIDATVTLLHSCSEDIESEIRRADVVIAAVGIPGFVRRDWVAPGAIVVDVGVTRVGTSEKGAAILAGDVDSEVADVAAWISRHPGGVGPMTRAMLVANVVVAAEAQNHAAVGRNGIGS